MTLQQGTIEGKAPAPNFMTTNFDRRTQLDTMMSRTMASFVAFWTFLLLASYATVANGWMLPSPMFGRTSVVLMGSQQARKWKKKQAWLDKRGYNWDGTPKGHESTPSVPFATIIGNGRIGSTLARAGNCAMLGREDTIDPAGQGPILIATRNDDLEGVVENCPQSRLQDLVFLQNGYLEGFLRTKGLQDASQALLYLSVPKIGVDPIDGITAVNPEGLTAATGIHAQAVADRLAALKLTCNVVSRDEHRPAVFEKMIWICAYMLVGTVKDCTSVGEVGTGHGELVEKVVREMVAAVSEKEGVAFPEEIVSRLQAYTKVVADFPCSLKEFEWRNKYFYDMGDEAMPVHNSMLKECGERGLVSLPPEQR